MTENDIIKRFVEDGGLTPYEAACSEDYLKEAVTSGRPEWRVWVRYQLASIHDADRRLQATELIAEGLHSKLCHYNHTDGCGWFYGPDAGPHAEYREKARALINAVGLDGAQAVVGIL